MTLISPEVANFLRAHPVLTPPDITEYLERNLEPLLADKTITGLHQLRDILNTAEEIMWRFREDDC